jgi:prepilin-type N-terminal cleavage/methylation domain-containing protein
MLISRFNRRCLTRAGYSLLEIMIVLAIMAATVSIMLPRAGAALDQVVVHTIQFDLQRQVSDLRRDAFLNKTKLRLVLAAASGVLAQSDPHEALAVLPNGWTASLDKEVLFLPSGVCSPANLRLSSLGKAPIRMTVTENCQLIRQFND